MLTLAKKRKEISECQICGESAHYAYFGVISCQPCKIFFKRNAENADKLSKCSLNGECEINVFNRHICSSCRLSKCFKQGMQIEKIRRSTSCQKSNQSKKFPTLNLLDKDNSTLDNNQWILLSNLLHNYNEKYLLNISEQLKNENRLIDSVVFINEDLVKNLLKSFYDCAGECVRSNNDISQLLLDDRSILVHTAADTVTTISGIFVFTHSHLIYDQILWKYLEKLYGTITMKYHRWSTKYTQTDPILFKLSMYLFAFSTNTRILHQNISSEYENLNEILAIQNKYVELTWKYIIYKYGFYQSIRIFDQIIRWFLSLTVFMFYAHHSQAHLNDMKSLIQQTETSLALDDIDKIIKL